MPTHWTYCPVGEEDDLGQGDIIEPTAGLRSVFEQVHPHFCDPKYIAFLVTTQSCDLVVRGGECASKYVSLAVVRRLDEVLLGLLAKVCQAVAQGVYFRESKGDANRFLQRLFNQNEQAMGLFYLHADSDVGIAIPAVALLRVSVTLRAEHYEVLRDSRRGRLDPSFAAKLGWLVGNLYSRIGTKDWPVRELRNLIDVTLSADETDLSPLWVNRTWIEAARQGGFDPESVPREHLIAEIEKFKPLSAKEAAVTRIIEIVRDVAPDIGEERWTRIENRLKQDSVFASALKRMKSE